MYKKILVINMLHIGDLLLATPVLTTLRANYPEAHIALLADAKIDSLVKFNKNIDELISVDKKGYHNKLGNYFRLILEVRRCKFDLVINLHPNERASALAAFSGARRIIGYSSPGFGIFFDDLLDNKNFDHKLKNRPDIPHQAAEHLERLENVLGITPVDRGLEMWLDEVTEKKAEKRWFAAFGHPSFKVVGFNTGASWPTKRWTAAGFAAVGDKLLEMGYGLAFFGGPMDAENVKDILELMKHGQHPRIAVFTGKLDLLELGALIRKCAVFLTNDSGPMHVAVAQKKAVVAIFGSSNEVGFGPYDKNSVVITPEGLTCRPCGSHNCDHHSCMTGIMPETVLEAVVTLAGPNELAPRPAVFFDRDGVLNVDTAYVYRSEDFKWNAGAVEAVKYFNDKGYYVFVVTNQSGVARGLYKEDDVHDLHQWMNNELEASGAHIDAFYYCPHHPEEGSAEYRKVCDCRKPEPGLILQALQEWPVEKTNSLLIGDKESDLAAAEAAGIKGFLFKGGDVCKFSQKSAEGLIE
ncbi:MAG: rfaF 3 [Firmicutes bacterium]|nr:rfaF 3 [Bacillota bacterium]